MVPGKNGPRKNSRRKKVVLANLIYIIILTNFTYLLKVAIVFFFDKCKRMKDRISNSFRVTDVLHLN